MTAIVTRHHAATSRFQILASGVALVRYSGPLSAECLHFFAASGIANNGPAPTGFLADYRKAVITASEAEWFAAVSPLHKGLNRAIAGSYVGAESTLEQLHAHAWNMSRHGFTRRVFLTVKQAHEWLLQVAHAG